MCYLLIINDEYDPSKWQPSDASDKKGIKMYRFLENLIQENCKEVTDIYGES